MKRILIALALFMGACGNEPATQMSREVFTQAIFDAVHARNPEIELKLLGDLRFSSEIDGSAFHGDLSYSYEQYLADPSKFDLIAGNWAMELAPDPDERGTMGERLVSVVRHADYVAQADMISRPLGGDQLAILMLDSPSSLVSISAQQLQTAGISVDDAWKLAAENLPVRLGETTWGQIGDGLPYAMDAASGLATGLLTHPDQCGAGKNEMEGRTNIVADRGVFISTIAGDQQSEQLFWAFIHTAPGSGALMSDTPLTCTNGEWVPAQPPN